MLLQKYPNRALTFASGLVQYSERPMIRLRLNFSMLTRYDIVCLGAAENTSEVRLDGGGVFGSERGGRGNRCPWSVWVTGC